MVELTGLEPIIKPETRIERRFAASSFAGVFKSVFKSRIHFILVFLSYAIMLTTKMITDRKKAYY